MRAQSLLPTDEHYEDVIEAIREGEVVMFLGAGASLCDRQAKSWTYADRKNLPTGSELAKYLANRFHYPYREFESDCLCCLQRGRRRHRFKEEEDLLRVAQYVEFSKQIGTLYRHLWCLFDRDYPPTSLHHLIAKIPEVLKSEEHQNPHVLILTTNYDDLMERAFEMAGEPVDVVYYVANGKLKGKFIHVIDGKRKPIDDPSSYTKISLTDKSIVFKVHGSVHRNPSEGHDDSFVITEDHYIDYLTRTDLRNIPMALAAQMRDKNFLFLGYSLRDWNLRALFQHIWKEQTVLQQSWAILRDADLLEAEFWDRRGIKLIQQDLKGYTQELAARLTLRTGPKGRIPAKKRRSSKPKVAKAGG